MPDDILKLIISIALYLVIGIFALISILGIYIVTKYGRTPAVTVIASLAFAGAFFLMTISTFITVSQLPS
jgi:hypothetical protein